MNAPKSPSPFYLDSAQPMPEGRRVLVEQERLLPIDVDAAYTKYLRDHHGDLSDTQELAETMFNAGARKAIENMVAFGDVIPLLAKIEFRIAGIRRVFEALQ